MRDLVRGYAAATTGGIPTAGERRRLAAELAAFGGALVRFEQLRQALADASIPAPVRRAIAADLLEGRAGAECVALAAFAVRYERPGELSPTLAALVALAEEAAGAAETPGKSPVEPPASRAAARERLQGYAERVFEGLAEPADVDRVGDELFAISRLLDGAERLRAVLADADVPYAERAAVAEDLFGARVSPSTMRMTRYVLRSGRTRDLVGTFEWLVELIARERGLRLAEVRSALPLAPEESERLAAALGRLVGRSVSVRVVVDESVLGGLLVAVGDLVIDGTLRHRFEQLRESLAQPVGAS